jgi:hypothetical protein
LKPKEEHVSHLSHSSNNAPTHLMQKCTECRQQINAFQNEYGESTMVGLEQIVLTDYMSSEHSDNGEINEYEYARHHRQSGGGENGLEIRREMWCSEQVSCD